MHQKEKTWVSWDFKIVFYFKVLGKKSRLKWFNPAYLKHINEISARTLVYTFNNTAKILITNEIEGIFSFPLRTQNTLVF